MVIGTLTIGSENPTYFYMTLQGTVTYPKHQKKGMFKVDDFPAFPFGELGREKYATFLAHLIF